MKAIKENWKLKGEKEMKQNIIAVDFDGTLCENK